MLGYIVWTTDRLTSLARARTAAAGPGGTPAAVIGGGLWRLCLLRRGHALGTPAAAGTRHEYQAGRPVLAPGLAACGKLAMSITMGYMLILML